MAQIRYSADARVCMVEDEDGLRVATQDDMDTLGVGPDLTDEEIAGLDE